ncbi:MAG: BLUF domain-containing protein [Pseudomonadota bacterium]
MNLTRIVYYSERNASLSLDVRQIISTSHKNNGRDSITGFLHFNGFYFLQVLEGGRAQLSACYHRIAADPRHTNIVLISAADVSERLFPSWSMGLHEGMDDKTSEIFLRYFATDKVDPETISSDSLLDVLQDVATELK